MPTNQAMNRINSCRQAMARPATATQTLAEIEAEFERADEVTQFLKLIANRNRLLMLCLLAARQEMTGRGARHDGRVEAIRVTTASEPTSAQQPFVSLSPRVSHPVLSARGSAGRSDFGCAQGVQSRQKMTRLVFDLGRVALLC